MHRRTFLALPALALALSACGTAATPSQPAAAPTAAPAATAAPAPTAGIEISNVWSRPALGPAEAMPTGAAMETKPTGMAMGDAKPTGAAMMGGMNGPTGAVFMTIHNTGGAADRLMKAVAMVSGVVEIHTVIDNNGVMEMRPVDGIDIPAGGTVMLKPGSFHIMLIGLKQDLKVGDVFDVTLQFEKAGEMKVKSTVRQPQ